MAGLRDRKARRQIATRVDRLSFGHEGGVAPVGEGISELRIHFGSGFRIYFKRQGDSFIIPLCGGDKRSQARAIKLVKSLAKDLQF